MVYLRCRNDAFFLRSLFPQPLGPVSFVRSSLLGLSSSPSLDLSPALHLAVLTERCCTYQPKRYASDTPKDGDAKDDVLDGLIHQRIEEKFAPEPTEEISEAGFALDYLSMLPSSFSMSLSTMQQEICEEGFWLDYLTPVPSRPIGGILDHIRRGELRRTPREWMHQTDQSRYPIALDSGYEELAENELSFGSDPTTRAAYRENEQQALRERRQTAFPPWAVGSITSAQRLVEREDYIEVEGGGKLSNKILDIELPVEDFRVDTRESILAKRKEEASISASALEALTLRVQNDVTLRERCGTEYMPMMLLTVGAQGSGKSKFSLDLVEHGALPWARINQDTIRLGKRGTREDCVIKAKYLLERGYCIVLDRMNFSVGA